MGYASHVFINDAEVTKADIDASNGVIHIVNRVLIPPKAMTAISAQASTIVDLAVATPDLSTLVAALKAGKLVDTLSGAGPFTVFAPTNEAFARLPKSLLDHLLDPKNIKTVEGKEVEARIFGSRVFINNAQVTKADIDASNGVIHIVDHVLIPPPTPPTPPTPPATKTIVD